MPSIYKSVHAHSRVNSSCAAGPDPSDVCGLCQNRHAAALHLPQQGAAVLPRAQQAQVRHLPPAGCRHLEPRRQQHPPQTRHGIALRLGEREDFPD